MGTLHYTLHYTTTRSFIHTTIMMFQLTPKTAMLVTVGLLCLAGTAAAMESEVTRSPAKYWLLEKEKQERYNLTFGQNLSYDEGFHLAEKLQQMLCPKCGLTIQDNEISIYSRVLVKRGGAPDWIDAHRGWVSEVDTERGACSVENEAHHNQGDCEADGCKWMPEYLVRVGKQSLWREANRVKLPEPTCEGCTAEERLEAARQEAARQEAERKAHENRLRNQRWAEKQRKIKDAASKSEKSYLLIGY